MRIPAPLPHSFNFLKWPSYILWHISVRFKNPNRVRWSFMPSPKEWIIQSESESPALSLSGGNKFQWYSLQILNLVADSGKGWDREDSGIV